MKSKLEQLEAAGVIDPGGLSEEEKASINGLSNEEIKHLISVRQKTGEFPEREGGRPWFL